METWSHFPARHAHYLELLAEAEQERRIRTVLANRPRKAPFFAPALAWLGRRLVRWGIGLRARYDYPPRPSPIMAAKYAHQTRGNTPALRRLPGNRDHHKRDDS